MSNKAHYTILEVHKAPPNRIVGSRGRHDVALAQCRALWERCMDPDIILYVPTDLKAVYRLEDEKRLAAVKPAREEVA